MKDAITFDHVSKRYNGKYAVEDLSLTIPLGTVTALLGPNGAGKTTSISMMLGLRRPTAGQVRLLGKDPTAPANRAHIGAMLQQVGLPGKLSVVETIRLFRSYYPHPLDTHVLLRLAGLEGDAKKESIRLSGGQRRRLQFALAMAGDPRILFLDEPTTAMDVTSRRAFWEQLRRFAREDGRTIVLTTHHLEEADAISDHIILLGYGRKIAEGSPAELKALTGNRFIAFTAGPGLTDEMLRALPGVGDIEWSGRRVRIRTHESDEVLRAMFMNCLDAKDFEVSSGGLEDAFISLTTNSEEAAG